LPLDIHSDVATYEAPWGHVQRPTHKNTTWDAAKFEVCGHKVHLFHYTEMTRVTYPTVRMKFADLSEYGYGVAILSESKYGFSCQGNVLRISLLRAATAPDAEQDQGSSCSSSTLPKMMMFSTQASMNSRGPYCPTMDTSSNRTFLSQLIFSIHHYMVRRDLLPPPD
jgi:alpha-mannosidase